MDGPEWAKQHQRIGGTYVLASVLGLSVDGRMVVLPIGAALLFVGVRRLGRTPIGSTPPPVVTVPLAMLGLATVLGTATWVPGLSPAARGVLGAAVVTVQLVGLRTWSASLARWTTDRGWSPRRGYTRARQAFDASLALCAAGLLVALATGARFVEASDTTVNGQAIEGQVRWLWLAIIPAVLVQLVGCSFLCKANGDLRTGRRKAAERAGTEQPVS